MNRVLFAMPGAEARMRALAGLCDAGEGEMNLRRFPDGETYFRLEPDLAGRSVGFVCGLDHPDDKLLALLMAAETARELGARRVGLIASYLPYMRQDRRFQPGEPVSARLFAKLVSRTFDWLVTVDPHLHRIRELSQIYPVRLGVVAAAPLVAAWISQHVARPLVVGPDGESEQWAVDVAVRLQAPWVVMRKQRAGDRDVAVTAPDLSAFADRTPVFVDDIVSSGATLVAAVEQLRLQGFHRPVCVAVHALYAEDIRSRLIGMGVRLASVDTVIHPTNDISCNTLLASEACRFL